MKKTLQLLGAFAIISISAISCGEAKESVDESKTSVSETTSKSVVAEVNDSGETTVTITSTENGDETIEVLTGEAAILYMAEEKIKMNESKNESSASTVIIKKVDSDEDNIDIEEIMNSEELQGLEKETKTKVKEALKEAHAKIDTETLTKDGATTTSKVIVIEK